LVVGLPGSKGQFSLLQASLRDGHQGRVRIDEVTRAQLQHLIELVEEAEPSRIEELVPGDSLRRRQAGHGRVWFTDEDEPLVWREPFPPNVQADVVSFDNLKGTVTNLDLELAGTGRQHTRSATTHQLSPGAQKVRRPRHTGAPSDWQRPNEGFSGQITASVTLLVWTMSWETTPAACFNWTMKHFSPILIAPIHSDEVGNSARRRAG
jgi:hypothetical protein